MTPDNARRYATDLAEAIAATASIPGDARLPAITAAWKQFGAPVVVAFHERGGTSLYGIYGEMLRTYGRACSQAFDEIQEIDPCTATY